MATFVIGARIGFFDPDSIEVHFPLVLHGAESMPIPLVTNTVEVVLPQQAWPDEATQDTWFFHDQAVAIEADTAPVLRESEDETDDAGNPLWVIQIHATAIRAMTSDEEALYKQTRRDATRQRKRAHQEERRRNQAGNN